MSNLVSGSALQLQDQAGAITQASQGSVMFMAISAALVGSLTVSNVIVGNTPTPWVIIAGSSGIVNPPGTTKFQGSLNYALSNPVDAGKATIVYING